MHNRLFPVVENDDAPAAREEDWIEVMMRLNADELAFAEVMIPLLAGFIADEDAAQIAADVEAAVEFARNGVRSVAC